MSQPTSPGETQTTNPVGTQDVSPGEPQPIPYVEKPTEAQPETATSSQLPTNPVEPQPIPQPEPQPVPVPPPTPQPTPLQTASQEAHDNALNGSVSQEQLNVAVAQAVKEQFEVTEGWQPKRSVQFIIHCPSGQTALVKHLDTRDLLRANLLEEMDRFTKQLFPSALDAQGAPVEQKDEDDEQGGIWSVLRDPDKRRRFFDMTNRLLVAASVKPKIVNDGVALHDNDSGEQEEIFGCEVDSIDEQIEIFGKPVPKLKDGEAYAGAIDFGDRMAFFQELNKPLGMIEPFREQSDAMLASMESSQSSPVQAERPV